MSNQTITLTDGGIEVSTKTGRAAAKTEKVSLLDGLKNIQSAAYFNSGLMPVHGTGVVSVRKALGQMQVVVQIEAGLHFIQWGARERSAAPPRMLAQPTRILILDYNMNQFCGARHFYSVDAAHDLDQPLYHVNLPNTNCTGYNNTTVGWTCLYGHNIPPECVTLGQKMHWATLRMSGDEAYNDANMSGTDGPRTYQRQWIKSTELKKFDFLYDPNAWEKKSKKEGFDWVNNKTLWMPIKVKGMNDQLAHDPSGEQFTLRHAMYGHYKAQYSDPLVPRAFNAIDREDLPNPTDQQILNALALGFASDLGESPVVGFDVKTGEKIHQGTMHYKAIDGLILPNTVTKYKYEMCRASNLYAPSAEMVTDEINGYKYHPSQAKTLTCPVCKKKGADKFLRYTVGTKMNVCSVCYRSASTTTSRTARRATR